jgi:DNA-binding NtrC family response regulator
MSEPNADLGNPGCVGKGSEAPDSEKGNHPLVIVAIDDDATILGFYQMVLGDMGVRLESSTDARRAMDLVQTQNPDLVILDVTMPGINGMELLRQMRSRDPQARVVMITGDYSIEMAVKAIQEGAIDYVCKPVGPEKLRELVTRVRNQVTQEERTRSLERELVDVNNLEGLIGRSPRMLEVFDLIQSVAPHFRTALIVGEPGSGRKSVARALHNLSPSKNQRFVVCASGALADNAVPPELSPEQGGPSTAGGAGEREPFDWAKGGTVFLDEIGNLSGPDQLRLLHILESSEAEDSDTGRVSAASLRVVASTSRDLQTESRSGGFRPDLWYRLSMVEIHVPPLRDRAEDILLLARHFVARYGAQYNKDLRRVSYGAEVALQAYSWPGNVRELESTIARACMLAEGGTVDCGDLPAGVVLPGYGDDILFGGKRGSGTILRQSGSASETLRQKVRDILDHRRE